MVIERGVKMSRLVIPVWLLLTFFMQSAAVAGVFDFANLPPGQTSTLTTTVDGVTLTVTRSDGVNEERKLEVADYTIFPQIAAKVVIPNVLKV